VKNHTKVYFKAFGYDTTDFIPCEVCRATAVDIHHIESRGMGGSKTADTIENLMALCRECHVEFGDKKHYKELLVATHAMRMSNL
jgi:5-methylcytosine-specific restriction endonuclease McrA